MMFDLFRRIGRAPGFDAAGLGERVLARPEAIASAPELR
jgi:hypothetical protein